MGGAFDAEEFDGDSGGFEGFFHFDGLGEGHRFVFVSVHEEEGRIVGGDVEEGGSFAVGAIFEGLGDFSRFASRDAHAEEGETGVAHGEEVGWGGAGDDALHFGAFALDGVGVVGVTFAIERSEHADEVAAGGTAGGSDFGGIDAELGGVFTDESHGALDVFDSGWVAEARERPVIDDEDGVACGGERLGVLEGLAVALQFGGGER